MKGSQYLRIALILVLIATFIIGLETFTTPHEFLTVSVIGLENVWIYGLIGYSFFLLFLVQIWTQNRWLFSGVLLLFLIFISLDISRLTPFFVTYLGIAFCLMQKQQQSELLVWMLGGIYIFSGLHKFNAGFENQILPSLWFYSLGKEVPSILSTALPALEALLGLGLLFYKSRRLSICLLIFMHLLLLWKLSPFKHNWNIIVWPWNLMMIAVLVFLWKSQKQLFQKKLSVSHLPIMVFFYLIPSLSLITPGFSNMGFQLYSGNVLFAEITSEQNINELTPYDRTNKDKVLVVNLQSYSIRHRQIAPLAEPWVYRKIQKQYEKHYGVNTELTFYNEWKSPSFPKKDR